MEHVAIMRKSWGLIPKILSGKKKIESRWYKNKAAPFGKINPGDVVYFKNTGEPVTLKAEAVKVLQFDNLNKEKVKFILDKYGEGIGITQDQIQTYFNLFKDKKYCLLIYLDNPQLIEPFEIDKRGFGAMAAWISVEDVSTLRFQTDLFKN